LAGRSAFGEDPSLAWAPAGESRLMSGLT
jgi:hypothetical protein